MPLWTLQKVHLPFRQHLLKKENGKEKQIYCMSFSSGNNSTSNNNKPEMWGWDGIMIALGLAWGWDMCLVILVVVLQSACYMNTFLYFEYYYVSNIFTEWI